jgi:hypothetical protein
MGRRTTKTVFSKNIDSSLLFSSLLFSSAFLALALASPAAAQSWTQLTCATPPPARFAASAVFDPNSGRMILFGGDPNGFAPDLNDVWWLTDPSGPSLGCVQAQPTGSLPAPRRDQSGVYDPGSDRMIIFGGGLGQTSPCANDAWVLDHASGVTGTPNWIQLSPSGVTPAPREDAAAVYDTTTNSMIMYGGGDCFSTGFGDLWILSSANGLGGGPAWSQVSPAGGNPGARSGHSAVYDSGSNSMIVFGGSTASNPVNNDAWVLSNANGVGGTPTWAQLSPSGPLPPPRGSFVATYDQTSKRMTVYGGNAVGVAGALSDTWVLSNADGTTGAPAWTELAPSGSAPFRGYASGVYDPSTNALAVFGGVGTTDVGPGLGVTGTNTSFVLSDANGLQGPGSAGDTTADRVFGQGGIFTSNACDNGGVNAASLCEPEFPAVDVAGDLYVADIQNNRVLEYNTPLVSDTTADHVFGQLGSFASSTCNKGGVSADSLCFTVPGVAAGSVATDANGNIYIGDGSNSRVLEYNSPLAVTAAPGSGDTTADLVFGQFGNPASGTCYSGGVSADSLCDPGVGAVDSFGNLYVTDGNAATQVSRVLRYNSPLTTDTTADLVLGEPNFSAGGFNFGLGATNAQGFVISEGVAVDTSVTPNRLYVGDLHNSRVLAWANVESLTNGAPADLVIGQPNSTSSACNNGGLSANSLCLPNGVTVDSAGNLYVEDTFNNRVLEYNTPFAVTAVPGSGDTTADRVFGQGGSFTSNGCNNGGVSADSLCFPIGSAVDSAGNLYVADTNNNRVLEYDKPLSASPAATPTPTPTPAPAPPGQPGGLGGPGGSLGGSTPVPSGQIAVSPAALNFNPHPIGSVSAPQTLTVTNNGLATVHVASLALSQDSFAETDNCTGTLAPHQSCIAQVVFAPTATGPAQASIRVSDDSTQNAATHPQAAALLGTGTAGSGLTAAPAAVSFAAQLPGTTSAVRMVRVTNNLSSAANITSVSASGGFAASNNCGTLNAGASCTISVTFAPAATGSKTGAISIASSATRAPVTVALSGVAAIPATPTPRATATSAPTPRPEATPSVAATARPTATHTPKPPAATPSPTPAPAQAALLVTPHHVSMGSAAVSRSAQALKIRRVVLSNPKNRKQDATIMIESVTASGAFAVDGASCVGPLAPGHKCAIEVSFAPSSAGAQTGALTITSNASNGTQTVSLAGKGTNSRQSTGK